MKYISLFFIASICFALSGNVTAEETYICLHSDSERRIKVVYTDPGSKVPCEVVYEKDTGSQVLWNAQNEEGYCEAKAAAFVDKQRGWGWDCALMEAPVATSTSQ